MVKLQTPKGKSTVECHIRYTNHVKIKSAQHLDEIFKNVVSKGGEGVMIRKPSSLYEKKDLLHC